jgi:hypothetical protein
MKMIVNSFVEVEELAKETVLFAMKNKPNEDFLSEVQSVHSIFHKVYDDLCRRQGNTIGSYFALHLKNKYKIEIPVTYT